MGGGVLFDREIRRLVRERRFRGNSSGFKRKIHELNDEWDRILYSMFQAQIREVRNVR